jgi:hypothetical protein
MLDFNSFAKMIILAGIVLTLVGILLLLVGKVPFFGKLPGDIMVQRKNFTFYFPLASGILLSIILTILLNIFLRR